MKREKDRCTPVWWLLLLLVAVAAIGATGCKKPAPPSAVAHSSSPVKVYDIRGKVVSTDASKGEVVLDAEAVKGFMDAMAMPYKLKDPGIIGELHPGDKITGKLLVDDNMDALLDQIVVVAQAKPDYEPIQQFHVPQKGDAVPDFKLLNQSGRTIHLAQFKGKVLLVTFIYTRCPLSDFCPRMSRNFAEIDKTLIADPALKTKTHLLSISFDPVYDDPAVLCSYGGAYTGLYTKEKFDHWDFAAPPQKELQQVTEYFDVGVTPGESKTLTHSLSTIIIGGDGKVANWYPTNDWTPAEILGAVRDAVAAIRS